MLNFLVVLFMFMQGSHLSCDDFYQKELDPLHIEGDVIKKEIGEQFYEIEVSDKKKGKLKFHLLKNMAGFEVYNFLLPGSHVFKKEGHRDIHVLTENKLDGSIKGKIFDNLCR